MTAAASVQGTVSASDAELVRQVLAGDRGTFAALVRRHNQRLFRACRAVLRDDHDAEDAAQAAWISAYRHLATYRGDAAFSSWVTRIALREATARLRRRDRAALVAIEEVTVPDEHDPERAASTGELGELLEHHVDALPDGLRTVLVLRDVLELDTAETATCLGITPEAVRVRLHRARHALAHELVGAIETALPDVWRFDGERCARMEDAVMAQVRSL
jgi:RNA polymerase sigma-70 factor (ECF subfamily)